MPSKKVAIIIWFCLCSSLTNLMSHFFVKIHRIWFMLLPSNKRPPEEQDQNFDDFFLYYYLLFYWHQFSWTPFVLDSPNFTSSHCDLGLSNDSRAIIPSKTLCLSLFTFLVSCFSYRRLQKGIFCANGVVLKVQKKWIQPIIGWTKIIRNQTILWMVFESMVSW